MSQHSLSSATSAFVPINFNRHNGHGDANETSSTVTKVDRAVEATKDLQTNANILAQTNELIDEALIVLDGIIFNGKRTVVSNLKTIQHVSRRRQYERSYFITVRIESLPCPTTKVCYF